MTGTIQKYAASEAITLELCCRQCGRKFLARHHPSEFDTGRDWTPPKFCPECRKDRREREERAKEKREAVKWREAAAKESAEFHSRLKSWQVAEMDAVRPGDDNILCILGNGFDLMHNVRSSYYAFRDSIGRNNFLRTTLEFYLTPEDIWADFEDSLARFNVGAMASSWQFVNELHLSGHMYLLNRRLSYVYLTDDQIVFVYNNRVCSFSLDDGKLISSKAVRNARVAHYEGLEVGQYFKR